MHQGRMNLPREDELSQGRTTLWCFGSTYRVHRWISAPPFAASALIRSQQRSFVRVAFASVEPSMVVSRLETVAAVSPGYLRARAFLLWRTCPLISLGLAVSRALCDTRPPIHILVWSFLPGTRPVCLQEQVLDMERMLSYIVVFFSVLRVPIEAGQYKTHRPQAYLAIRSVEKSCIDVRGCVLQIAFPLRTN